MQREIKLKGVCAPRDELELLQALLEKVGAKVEISFINDFEQASTIQICIDEQILRQKTTRYAGRKTIVPEITYTIGDVKEKVDSEGLESVLVELQMSRSTYFRRMKNHKQWESKDSETF